MNLTPTWRTCLRGVCPPGLIWGALIGCACSPPPDPPKQNTKTRSRPLALRGLFTQGEPQLPAVYAPLRLGMPREEALQHKPSLATQPDLRSPDYPLLSFSLRFSGPESRFSEAWLSLPKLEAAALLMEAWGPPIKALDKHREPLQLWVNPQTQLCATLREGFADELSLSFTHCLPSQVLIGAALESGPAQAFAFEQHEALPQRQILGASAEALRTAFGAAFTQERPCCGQILLPPTEFSPETHTRVHVDFDEQQLVERLHFHLSYGPTPGIREEIESLLGARFGPSTQSTRYGRPTLLFAEAPLLQAQEHLTAKSWVIQRSLKPAAAK